MSVNRLIGGHALPSDHLLQGRFTRVMTTLLTAGNRKRAGQVKLQANRQAIKGTV
jgi:hypothetical protein